MSNDRPPNPLLALETSGKAMGAALYGPSGLLCERRTVDGARHGVALAPMIRELLGQGGLKVQDLSAVAVSLGPGSWTGLRIGLAAAKAMAWAAGIALVGVPSLEALAWGIFRQVDRHAPPGTGKGNRLAVSLTALRDASCAFRQNPAPAAPLVLTVRSAYTEGLYVALFRETPAGPERLIEESVLRPEALAARVVEALVVEALKLANARADEVSLCGEDVCLAELAPAAQAAGWRVLAETGEVPAAALAERAWARLAAGQAWRTPAEIHRAAPLYLRASDPELKLRRKHAPPRGT